MKRKNMRPFNVLDEIGYAAGDMGGSFVNLFVDTFFLMFCTYVLGISPKWMGGLFLIARLWDAINDPIIGSFPDRWHIGKSKNKFKPYICIAMFPLALSCLFCFANVSNFSLFAKHVWVAFAYIFYGMSYTGTSMPFGSMASVITSEPIERTKLSRARAIGGTIVGYGAIAFVPQFVYNSSGKIIPDNFFCVSVAFAICSILCYFILLTFTQERIVHPKSEQKEFRYSEVLKDILKNRPLIGVMIATVGSLIYITGNSQIGNYMYKEFYHAPKIQTLVSMLNIPLILIAFPLIPRLSARFGKKKIITICAAYNLIIATFLFLVPIHNVYAYLFLSTIGNSGQVAFIMLIWAFVTDCIDYQEYRTGHRNDGSLYSIYTFSRKIGSTIASSLASFALAAIGYISGIESQSAQVAMNIRTLFTAIPVTTCVLELIGIGLIFNLTKEDSLNISKFLREKHLQNNINEESI